MTNELPSNVPPKIDGHVSVTVYRDRLWPDLIEKGVDVESVARVESSIKFMQLWQEELQERLPGSLLYFTSSPGHLPALVSASDNHPNPSAVKEALRIGQSVFSRHQDWVVRRSSQEAREIEREYASYRSGEEADSAEDGGGVDAASGAVLPRPDGETWDEF